MIAPTGPHALATGKARSECSPGVRGPGLALSAAAPLVVQITSEKT